MIAVLSIVCVLVMLASLAWIVLPRSTWPGLGTQWRRLPRSEAILLVLLMAAGTWYGADKGHVARTARVAQLLSVMASGDLKGPTNIVASAVAAAAVQEVLDESDYMYAVASNAVKWCQSEIPDLEYAITNMSIAYMQSEIPAPLDSLNPVARADLLQVADGADGVKHVMVAFSVIPSSAPLIEFWADDQLCTAVSNSFPDTVAVATPSGTTDCYVYTVQVPPALSGVVMLPDREIIFGGGPDNKPLSVLGALMVNDKFGITGERLISPGVVGDFEGGVLVGVRDDN